MICTATEGTSPGVTGRSVDENEPTEVRQTPTPNVGRLCREAVRLLDKLASSLESAEPYLCREPDDEERYLVQIKGPAGFQFVQGPMTAAEAADFCREFGQAAAGSRCQATPRRLRKMIGDKRRRRRQRVEMEPSPHHSPATHPAVFCQAPTEQPQAFLRQALELWGAGHELPAVIMARLAIEAHLFALCIRHPYIDAGRLRRDSVICRAHLLKAGAISKKTMGRIDNVFQVASSAAHARPISYTRMAYVIQAARTIVETWPAAGEEVPA